jgi:hypothetical protein
MTFLYIFLIFVSYGIGVLTAPLFNKKTKQQELNQRKGLLIKNFSVSNDYTGKTGTIQGEFEILELERTNTKSKVKVINCHSNKSEYNSGTQKQELIKMVDESWIESNEIEWIEKSAQDKREEKLNELLK